MEPIGLKVVPFHEYAHKIMAVDMSAPPICIVGVPSNIIYLFKMMEFMMTNIFNTQ